MQTHILILAAGASSRMRGGDKCLEPVAGEALLRRLARLGLGAGCAVTVALPPDRPARDAALDGLAVTRVTVADAAKGMAASLVAGVSALPPDAAVLLVLADLPMLDAADLATLLAEAAAHPDAILRGADAGGAAGHPVLFPADLRGELLALTGDEGARSVLRRHAGRVRLVPLPAGHATTDLDTPEDWAAWRKAGSGAGKDR
ncbi:nucleotidyltransferase family protein [Paragemmobacter straminiformis]|uniref:Nucleotidyltransferase family protein n=1 Tax=Paragemmobacter straminiformis TaxID=2045119 RepID=A0A842I6Z5_9RHOB|nr:nucleotidyltransferase family protein [Gemmobacter straminiformis]MBC2835361.1 nucleotidyltransferase family protein [Gemmobacter straminiformis]